MPDQAYTLPEDWEQFEEQKKLEAEKARVSLQLFLEKFPEYEGNAWPQDEAWELFHFENWIWGIARVKRLSDNQWGWLYHNDNYAIRIYYNFRPADFA